MESKKNQLLLKSEIGQVKQTTMDLPGQSHIYGKKSQPDAFGARALVSSWNEHSKNELVAKERDFTKMNKLCVQQKVIGKDISSFRQENSNLMKQQVIRDKKPMPVELSAASIYGKANRPSTPIKGVLNGQYEAMAEQERQDNIAAMRRNKSQVRAKPTKAVELARQEAMKKANVSNQSHLDCFKMKKFSAVQGRVNTNRMIQSSRPGQDSTPAAESQDLNQEQAAE